MLGSSALGDLADPTTTYNPSMDPSIFNEFATVAYRSWKEKIDFNCLGLVTLPLVAYSKAFLIGSCVDISLSKKIKGERNYMLIISALMGIRSLQDLEEIGGDSR